MVCVLESSVYLAPNWHFWCAEHRIGMHSKGGSRTISKFCHDYLKDLDQQWKAPN
jgi:hypothetical protein